MGGQLGSLCSILCHFRYWLFDWYPNQALSSSQRRLFCKITSCGVTRSRVSPAALHWEEGPLGDKSHPSLHVQPLSPSGGTALGACVRSLLVTWLPDATIVIHRKALCSYIRTTLISVCLAEGDNQGARFSSWGCGMTGHCCCLPGQDPVLDAACAPTRGDTTSLDPQNNLGLSQYHNIQCHKTVQALA